jgi:alpha-tubulin suppressor-like RCC1 family protein
VCCRQVEFFKDYGAKISSISCGSKHTIFLTDDGEVLACGVGEYGLLGNGETSDSKYPTSLTFFENMIITSVSAGLDHSLALSNDGQVFSWGRNNHGQLGHSDSYMDIYSLENIPRKIEVESTIGDVDEHDEKVKFKQISSANGRSVAISKDGSLYVWGHRLVHRPKLMERSLFDGLAVRKVLCGGESSRSVIAVITEDYGLWTFGDTSSKMLARPGSGKQVDPERVPAFKGKKVLDIFTGFGQHIFAKVQIEE